jgi:hypothetical protein
MLLSGTSTCVFYCVLATLLPTGLPPWHTLPILVIIVWDLHPSAFTMHNMYMPGGIVPQLVGDHVAGARSRSRVFTATRRVTRDPSRSDLATLQAQGI